MMLSCSNLTWFRPDFPLLDYSDPYNVAVEGPIDVVKLVKTLTGKAKLAAKAKVIASITGAREALCDLC